MCGATESAQAIVPETHDLNNSLMIVATQVANAIDALLADLDRRIEALRGGQLHRNCHSPSVDLKSWRKIMIAYSVFQNGCLAGC
jgi:hypothetical protein